MGSMTSTDIKLTVPEAARRLGVDGGDVYRLIFRGVLQGGPSQDGAVYVTGKAVEEYLSRCPQDAASSS